MAGHNDSIHSKTGKLETVRQGHTATGNFGDGPDGYHNEIKAPRDLKPGMSR